MSSESRNLERILAALEAKALQKNIEIDDAFRARLRDALRQLIAQTGASTSDAGQVAMKVQELGLREDPNDIVPRLGALLSNNPFGDSSSGPTSGGPFHIRRQLSEQDHRLLTKLIATKERK